VDDTHDDTICPLKHFTGSVVPRKDSKK